MTVYNHVYYFVKSFRLLCEIFVREFEWLVRRALLYQFSQQNPIFPCGCWDSKCLTGLAVTIIDEQQVCQYKNMNKSIYDFSPFSRFLFYFWLFDLYTNFIAEKDLIFFCAVRSERNFAVYSELCFISRTCWLGLKSGIAYKIFATSGAVIQDLLICKSFLSWLIAQLFPFIVSKLNGGWVQPW